MCIFTLQGLLSIGLASHPTPLDKPSWKLRGTSQLMAQAGSAYLMLAKISLEQNKLGRALRYGKYSVLSSSEYKPFILKACIVIVQRGFIWEGGGGAIYRPPSYFPPSRILFAFIFALHHPFSK